MADREGGTPALNPRGRYDPERDAGLRYPEWLVAHVDLGGVVPEVLCRRRRVILLDRGLDPAGARSSLAHALAHLDLGHAETLAGFFERREERAADDLAARRLIPLGPWAAALRWSASDAEVAAELEVDRQMLEVRRRGLSGAERIRLRRLVGSPAA